jgi:hypothetical protein
MTMYVPDVIGTHNVQMAMVVPKVHVLLMDAKWIVNVLMGTLAQKIHVITPFPDASTLHIHGHANATMIPNALAIRTQAHVPAHSANLVFAKPSERVMIMIGGQKTHAIQRHGLAPTPLTKTLCMMVGAISIKGITQHGVSN